MANSKVCGDCSSWGEIPVARFPSRVVGVVGSGSRSRCVEHIRPHLVPQKQESRRDDDTLCLHQLFAASGPPQIVHETGLWVRCGCCHREKPKSNTSDIISSSYSHGSRPAPTPSRNLKLSDYENMAPGRAPMAALLDCCIQVEWLERFKPAARTRVCRWNSPPCPNPYLPLMCRSFSFIVFVAGCQEQATAAGTPVQARAMVSRGDRLGRRSRSSCPRER